MFRKIKLASLLLAAVCVLCGLMLLTNPDGTARAVCRVVGVVLLITGVLRFLDRDGATGAAIGFGMANGAFDLAAGVALTFFAGLILSVLNIIVGLLLLLGGIFGLRPALDAKALGARYWPAALACSIVGIVLGVAMLAGCFSAVSAVFWICGMALVIYGLEQAVVIINLLRN